MNRLSKRRNKYSSMLSVFLFNLVNEYIGLDVVVCVVCLEEESFWFEVVENLVREINRNVNFRIIRFYKSRVEYGVWWKNIGRILKIRNYKSFLEGLVVVRGFGILEEFVGLRREEGMVVLGRNVMSKGIEVIGYVYYFGYFKELGKRMGWELGCGRRVIFYFLGF